MEFYCWVSDNGVTLDNETPRQENPESTASLSFALLTSPPTLPRRLYNLIIA